MKAPATVTWVSVTKVDLVLRTCFGTEGSVSWGDESFRIRVGLCTERRGKVGRVTLSVTAVPGPG